MTAVETPVCPLCGSKGAVDSGRKQPVVCPVCEGKTLGVPDLLGKFDSLLDAVGQHPVEDYQRTEPDRALLIAYDVVRGMSKEQRRLLARRMLREVGFRRDPKTRQPQPSISRQQKGAMVEDQHPPAPKRQPSGAERRKRQVNRRPRPDRPIYEEPELRPADPKLEKRLGPDLYRLWQRRVISLEEAEEILGEIATANQRYN